MRSPIYTSKKKLQKLEQELLDCRVRLNNLSDNDYNRWGKVVENKLTSLEKQYERELAWCAYLEREIA